MRALESVIGSLSLFRSLRPDEIGRIARRFAISQLAAGETRRFEPTTEAARLIVIASGTARLAIAAADPAPDATPTTALGATLGAGDRWGELELLTGRPRDVTLVARRACTLATLDRAGLDAILAEFPAVALPLATELARELHATDDAARELAELHAEQLSRPQLVAALAARRRAHLYRAARVRRFSVRGLFHRLVVQRGSEPAFWILVGFVVAVFLARVVVALIFKFNLQKQLFALVPGPDPNPMHVHHFNYGLVLIGLSGIAAMFRFGRRVLRALAFVFGFGFGLVLDEFALIWNLNPSYENAHLTVAAFAAALLVMLAYFRRLWAELARHLWHRLRGLR